MIRVIAIENVGSFGEFRVWFYFIEGLGIVGEWKFLEIF